MLRDAVQDALKPDEWQCMREISDVTGESKYAVKKALSKLVERGIALRTTSADGQPLFKLK